MPEPELNDAEFLDFIKNRRIEKLRRLQEIETQQQQEAATEELQRGAMETPIPVVPSGLEQNKPQFNFRKDFTMDEVNGGKPLTVEQLFAERRKAGKTSVGESEKMQDLAQQGIADAPENTATGKKGLKEFFTKDAKVAQALPFIGGADEAATAASLYESAKRINDGTANKRDEQIMREYITQSKRDTTLPYKIASIVYQIPAFAAELGLTGGIYSAGKKAALESAEKLIKGASEKFIAKSAAAMVGSAAQLPVAGATRIAAETIENMAPHFNLKDGQLVKQDDGTPLVQALPEAYVNQFVETFTEHSGAGLAKIAKTLIGRPIAAVASKIPMPEKAELLTAAAKKWLSKYPNSSFGQMIENLKTKGAYHGWLEEIGEERLGEVARPFLFNLTDPQRMVQEYEAPSLEQLGAEAVAFAIPGAASKIMDSAMTGMEKRARLKELIDVRKSPAWPKYLEAKRAKMDADEFNKQINSFAESFKQEMVENIMQSGKTQRPATNPFQTGQVTSPVVQPPQPRTPEQAVQDGFTHSFTTEKGSIYYVKGGSTERFKTSQGSQHAPSTQTFYVPPQVADQILDHINILHENGEKSIVTLDENGDLALATYGKDESGNPVWTGVQKVPAERVPQKGLAPVEIFKSERGGNVHVGHTITDVKSLVEPPPVTNQEQISSKLVEPNLSEKQPTISDNKPPVVQSETPKQEPVDDLARYKQVQEEITKLTMAGDFDSPAFQALWKENEEIKNRHGGMPPQEAKAEQPKPKKEIGGLDEISHYEVRLKPDGINYQVRAIMKGEGAWPIDISTHGRDKAAADAESTRLNNELRAERKAAEKAAKPSGLKSDAVNEVLNSPENKASLEKLGVNVVRMEKSHPYYSAVAKRTGGVAADIFNSKNELLIHEPRLNKKLESIRDAILKSNPKASEQEIKDGQMAFLKSAVAEEIIHFAQRAAVLKVIGEANDKISGEEVKEFYSGLWDEMNDAQKRSILVSYAHVNSAAQASGKELDRMVEKYMGGKFYGSIEFVRQLIQMERTGTVSEDAHLDATQSKLIAFLKAILAQLKLLAAEFSKDAELSTSIKKAIKSINDVLNTVEAKEKPQTQEQIFEDLTKNKFEPITNLVAKDLYEGRAPDKTILKSMAGNLPAKEVDEQIELGVVIAARNVVNALRKAGRPDSVIFNQLVNIYNNQPTLNAKTSTSKINQAYSTPAPIAFAVSVLTDMKNAVDPYEPTAGNGMLLIDTEKASLIHANEIDKTRADNLEKLDKKIVVTRSDATKTNPNLPSDRIIMNPPFGNVKDENGQAKDFSLDFKMADGKPATIGTRSIDHSIVAHALLNLDADGKAGIIIGGMNEHMLDDADTNFHNHKNFYRKDFYTLLYQNYNVVDHFIISGDLYRKQGAGWPIDVIIVHGKGKSALPLPSVKPPTTIIRNWNELETKIKEGVPQATTGQKPAEPVLPDGGRSDGGKPPTKPADQNRPDVRDEGSNADERPGKTGGRTGDASKKPDDGRGTPRVESGERRPDSGNERGGTPAQPPAGKLTESAAKALSDNADKLARIKAIKDKLKNRPAGASPSEESDPEALQSEMEQLGIGVARDLIKAGTTDYAEFKQQLTDVLGEGFEEDIRGWYEANRYKSIFKDVKFTSPEDIAKTPSTTPAEESKQPITQTEKAAEPAKTKEEAETQAAIEDLQVPYTPVSNLNSGQFMVPRNLSDPMRESLLRLQDEVGDLNDYVRKKLLIADVNQLQGAFFAEQVEAIASVIYNIDKGQGYIVGDMTGSGKGRVAAAIIRYAELSGKVPIFVTQSDGLYNAMLSDLRDIGSQSIVPMFTNNKVNFTDEMGRAWKQDGMRDILEEVTRVGYLPDIEVDVLDNSGGITSQKKPAQALFTTYAQLYSDIPKGFKETKQQRNSRKRKGNAARPDGVRMQALRALAPNSIFILDESHTASGADSDIGIRMKQLLDAAQGAYYSSATFAKNADAMPLYFKTSMRDAGLSPQQIVQLFTHGGLPIQQAATFMLAKDGQYRRLESSFKGISFKETIGLQNAKRDEELSDEYMDIIRELSIFGRRMGGVLEGMRQDMEGRAVQVEGKVDEGAVGGYNFASQLFIVARQYLLALKTQTVADTAANAIEAGEKPFIIVDNTMEGPLDDIVQNKYPLNFQGVLLRYLRKIMTIKERQPGSEDVVERVMDKSELPQDMQDYYDQIEGMITDSDLGGMPLSPIDALKNILSKTDVVDPVTKKKRKVRIDEITGRSQGVDYDTGKVYNRPSSDRSVKGKIEIGRKFNGISKSGESLDALIINGSAATGYSFHASEKFKDQRPRKGLLWQAALDINTVMQAFGRINRKGQTVLPSYEMLTTALPAELRPAAVLSANMAKMSAVTTSNADSQVGQVSKSSPDIFNKYGDEVVLNVMLNNPTFVTELAHLFPDGESDVQAMHDSMEEHGSFAAKITGHAVVMKKSDQDKFWSEIQKDYDAKIKFLDEAGENDLRVTTQDYKAEVLDSQVIFDGEGTSSFNGPAVLERVKIISQKKPLTLPEIDKIAQSDVPQAHKDFQDFKQRGKVAENEAVAAYQKRSSAPDVKIEASIRAKYVDAINAAEDVVASLLGKNVDYKTREGVIHKGVVTRVEFDDETFKPSSQHVIAWINTTGQRIRIPLSQAKERFTRNYAAQPEFEKQYQDTAELGTERHIVTGNLFGGYSFLQKQDVVGKIINYTTKDGEVLTGIQLPASYKGGKYIPVTDYNAARMTVMGQQNLLPKPKDPQPLESPEGVKIRKHSDANIQNTIQIVVPASKIRGGKFWQNPKLNELLEDGQFVQIGSSMVGSVNATNGFKAVFNFLKDNLNQKFGYVENDFAAARQQKAPPPNAQPTPFTQATPAAKALTKMKQSPTAKVEEIDRLGMKWLTVQTPSKPEVYVRDYLKARGFRWNLLRNNTWDKQQPRAGLVDEVKRFMSEEGFDVGGNTPTGTSGGRQFYKLTFRDQNGKSITRWVEKLKEGTYRQVDNEGQWAMDSVLRLIKVNPEDIISERPARLDNKYGTLKIDSNLPTGTAATSVYELQQNVGIHKEKGNFEMMKAELASAASQNITLKEIYDRVGANVGTNPALISRLASGGRVNEVVAELSRMGAPSWNYFRVMSGTLPESIKNMVAKDTYGIVRQHELNFAKVRKEVDDLTEEIRSNKFQRKLITADKAKMRADRLEKLNDLFQQQTATAIAAANKILSNHKSTGAQIDSARRELEHHKEMLTYSEAIKQRANDMLKWLGKDKEGIHLLFDTKYTATALDLITRYNELKDEAVRTSAPATQENDWVNHRGKVEEQLVAAVANVIARNREVSRDLGVLYFDSPYLQKNLSRLDGYFIKKLGVKDATNAYKKILEGASKKGSEAERAFQLWSAINKPLVAKLKQLDEATEMAALADEIEKSLEWRTLQRDLQETLDVIPVPARYSQTTKDKQPIIGEMSWDWFFPMPDEKEGFQIHLRGTDKAELGEQVKLINEKMEKLNDWLLQPENADHPEFRFWENQYELLKNFYSTSLVSGIIPSTDRSLLTLGMTTSQNSAWSMAEFMFKAIHSPAANIAAVAANNWKAGLHVAEGWSPYAIAELTNKMTLAARAHSTNKNNSDAASLILWYRDVGNELAWSAQETGRTYKVGDVLGSGRVVKKEDIAFLRTQHEFVNKLYSAHANIGRSKIMEESRLYDDKLMIYRKPLSTGDQMLPRKFNDANKQWVKDFYRLASFGQARIDSDESVRKYFSDNNTRAAVSWKKLSDEQKKLLKAHIETKFNSFMYAFAKDRDPAFARVQPWEAAFKDLANDLAKDLQHTRENPTSTTALAPRTVDEVIDYLYGRTTGTITLADVEDGLMDEIIRQALNVYDQAFDDAAKVLVENAPMRNSFTAPREKALASFFFYTYGLESTPSVVGFGIDSASYWFERYLRALEGTNGEGGLIGDLEKAKAEKESEYQRLAITLGSETKAEEQIVKQQEARIKAGEAYTSLQDLEKKLSELKRYRDGLKQLYSSGGKLQRENSQALERFGGDLEALALASVGALNNITGSSLVLGAMLAQRSGSSWGFGRALMHMLHQVSFSSVPAAYKFGSGVVKNVPKAFRALGKSGSAKDKAAGFLLELAGNLADSAWENSEYYQKLKKFGVHSPNPLGLTLANRVYLPSTGGKAIPEVKSKAGRVAWAVANGLEMPLEVIRAAFPRVFDVSANMIAMRAAEKEVQQMENHLRELFEKTPVSRWDFKNPGNNVLLASDVIPFNLLVVGPRNMNSLREIEYQWKRAGIPLKETIVDFMERLSKEPDKAARAKIQLLPDADAVGQLGLILAEDLNISTALNRPQNIRSNAFLRQFLVFKSYWIHLNKWMRSTYGDSKHDPQMKDAMLKFLGLMMFAIFGLGLFGIVGGNIQRLLDRYLYLLMYGEKRRFPLAGEGKTAGEETRNQAALAFNAFPILSDFSNMLLSSQPFTAGYGFNTFMQSRIQSVAGYVTDSIRSGDPTFKLPMLVKAMMPMSKVVLNRTESQEGLLDHANTVKLLKFGAPEDLKRNSAVVASSSATELSPYREKIINDIMAGRDDEAKKHYNEAIEVAKKIGKKNPTESVNQSIQSKNPIMLGLRVMPSQSQLDEILNRNGSDAAALKASLERYKEGAAKLGIKINLTKSDKSGGSSGSGGAPIQLPETASTSRSSGGVRLGGGSGGSQSFTPSYSAARPASISSSRKRSGSLRLGRRRSSGRRRVSSRTRRRSGSLRLRSVKTKSASFRKPKRKKMLFRRRESLLKV